MHLLILVLSACARPGGGPVAPRSSSTPAPAEAPAPVAPATPPPAPSSDPDRECDDDLDCALDANRWCNPAVAGHPRTADDAICGCDDGGRCHVDVPPVACTTWRDCSWSWEPVLHLVPASERPRPVPRPVRPCVDSEYDAVCADGTCVLRHWSC